MKKIHILHCLPDFHIGGVCRLMLTNLTHLDPDRFTHTVMSFGPRDDLLGEYRRVGMEPVFLGHRGNRTGPRTFQRLTHLIRHREIDIVHTHMLTDRIYGGAAARLVGSTVVTTIHSTKPQPTFRLSGVSNWSRSLKWKAADRMADRWASRVVVVSRVVGKVAVESRGISRDKIELVYSGVTLPDTERLASVRPVVRREVGLGDRPTAVCVGRLVDWKRQDVAVEALARLVEKIPNAMLMIVGDGPKLPELERLAASLGLTEIVRFVGRQTDVDKFLAAADVFVMPSTPVPEGLGIALLEAMAAGLPVVATDSAPFDEIVSPGDEGYLAKTFDPVDFADKMGRILASREMARTMGDRARRTIENRFSASVSAKRLGEVYVEALSGSS